MGSGAFYFVENAMQMEADDCAEFFACGLGSCVANCFEIGKQAIEGVVLAEEEDFVFAAEIVVKVSGGEVGGGGDFEAAGDVAALEAGGAHGDRMALREVGVNEK